MLIDTVTKCEKKVNNNRKSKSNKIRCHSISGLLAIIEIRLECRCLQKCFLIWKYYASCLWAPLLVLTQSKETVSWSNLVFFYNKSKILTILFIVKYEKITLFYEFLVLLGPIISRFFACSNEEKINKNSRVCLL